ncbi:MAG: DNA-3-methyladenine glycosylase I [Methylobacter sp.]
MATWRSYIRRIKFLSSCCKKMRRCCLQKNGWLWKIPGLGRLDSECRNPIPKNHLKTYHHEEHKAKMKTSCFSCLRGELTHLLFYMQATGMINDHTVGCFRYRQT